MSVCLLQVARCEGLYRQVEGLATAVEERQAQLDRDSKSQVFMEVQLKLETSKSHGSIFRLLQCHFKVPNYFVIYSMFIKMLASIFSLSIFSVTRCQFPVPIPLFAR